MCQNGMRIVQHFSCHPLSLWCPCCVVLLYLLWVVLFPSFGSGSCWEVLIPPLPWRVVLLFSTSLFLVVLFSFLMPWVCILQLWVVLFRGLAFRSSRKLTSLEGQRHREVQKPLTLVSLVLWLLFLLLLVLCVLFAWVVWPCRCHCLWRLRWPPFSTWCWFLSGSFVWCCFFLSPLLEWCCCLILIRRGAAFLWVVLRSSPSSFKIS